jgi:CHAT domain-containing protein
LSLISESLVGAITHLSDQEAYYNMLESDYNAALAVRKAYPHPRFWAAFVCRPSC